MCNEKLTKLTSFTKYIRDLVDSWDSEILYTPNGMRFVKYPHNATIGIIGDSSDATYCGVVFSGGDSEIRFSHKVDDKWTPCNMRIRFGSIGTDFTLILDNERYCIASECDFFSAQLIAPHLSISYQELLFCVRYIAYHKSSFRIFYGIGEELSYGYS